MILVHIFFVFIVTSIFCFSSDAGTPAELETYLFADQKPTSSTYGALLWRDGKVEWERYESGFTKDTRWQIWSMSKSFLGTLVGIAVKENKVKLDGSICDYGFKRHCEIKLEHLMRWQSCLKWSEGYEKSKSPATSDVVQMLYGRGRADMVSFIIDRPLECVPGSRMRYSSGDSNLLSAVLKNVYGADYDKLPEKLFGPLGIKDVTWEKDGKGVFVGSSYLYLSTHETLKLGLLHLQDGVWEGKRLLPEGWVKLISTPSASTDPAEDDLGGMQWWTRDGVLVASGHWGQSMAIFPKHNAVVVRIGNSRDSGYSSVKLVELSDKFLSATVAKPAAVKK